LFFFKAGGGRGKMGVLMEGPHGPSGGYRPFGGNSTRRGAPGIERRAPRGSSCLYSARRFFRTGVSGGGGGGQARTDRRQRCPGPLSGGTGPTAKRTEPSRPKPGKEVSFTGLRPGKLIRFIADRRPNSSWPQFFRPGGPGFCAGEPTPTPGLGRNLGFAPMRPRGSLALDHRDEKRGGPVNFSC